MRSALFTSGKRRPIDQHLIDLKDVVRTVQKGAAFKYGLKLPYTEALQTLKHPVFDDEETATEKRSNPDP
jgi:hypothetical protein